MANLKHCYATINGLTLHYVVAGEGEPVLLIHGFPQTWYEWRQVMSELTKTYTVIVPDYRGAGESERPQGGYDKHTMMEDLRGLVQQLGFKRLRVVGHDVGAMIAYRYAAVHPDEVLQLVLMDAPIAGTLALNQIRAMPRSWHANFHNARDVAEMLVSGREREYLRYFFRSRFAKPNVMSETEMGVYIEAYSSPGGMRAGFELYRAWDQDAKDNKPYLERQLSMPVLVLGSEVSASGPLLEAMTHEIASQGQFKLINNAGHWLCEENPLEVQCALLEFFEPAPIRA